MNDDALLPEWDRESSKTALDSRLQELFLMHVAGDPRWVRTTMALAGDLVDNDEVVEMLSSVCVFVTNLVIWTYGRDEAVERFTRDLQELRAIAIKEAQS